MNTFRVGKIWTILTVNNWENEVKGKRRKQNKKMRRIDKVKVAVTLCSYLKSAGIRFESQRFTGCSD
jgi:hypothetical protein